MLAQRRSHLDRFVAFGKSRYRNENGGARDGGALEVALEKVAGEADFSFQMKILLQLQLI